MAIKDLVPRFGRGREQVPARREEFEPFRDFQREMNRLFNDFWGEFPLATHEGSDAFAAVAFHPRVDLAETDKNITVSAELPGLDEKEITVEMDDTAITIRGEKKHEKEEKGKNWHLREQSYGSFHRIVPLPVSVDGSKAHAKFKKGVLTITAPKREGEQTKCKTIAIAAE